MNAVYKKFNYKPNAASKKQDHKPKDNSIENMVWMRLVEENNNKKPETKIENVKQVSAKIIKSF